MNFSLFPSVYPSPFLLFPFPTVLHAARSAVGKGKRRKGEGYTLGKREGKEKRKRKGEEKEIEYRV